MTKNTFLKKTLSRFGTLLLIAVIALSAAACQSKSDLPKESSPSDSALAENQKVSFTFICVDEAGQETKFNISTDEKTVGAALLKEGLIEGENSTYGLYVKKVNGITADFDIDGSYWAFYIGEEYASTGVDKTEIKPGETYVLKKTKG